jgi:hypothetical protein
MRCQPATFVAMALLGLAGAAGPAASGPWAREAGEAFLSFSISGDGSTGSLAAVDMDLSHHVSVYGEYGVGRRMTLAGRVGRGDTSREAMIVLRYTLTPSDAPWQVAIEGGAGLRTGAAISDTRLLRLGASIGRGFGGVDTPRWWLPIRHEGGWTSLDATGLYDIATGELNWQAEATLGMAVSDRLRLMLQLKAEDWPDDATAYTVTPGAALSLSDDTTLQAGARLGLGDEQTLGVSLGLWHSF